MQEVVIYSKPHCPSCVKAKAVFDKMNVEYKTYTLGTDIQPKRTNGTF